MELSYVGKFSFNEPQDAFNNLKNHRSQDYHDSRSLRSMQQVNSHAHYGPQHENNVQPLPYMVELVFFRLFLAVTVALLIVAHFYIAKALHTRPKMLSLRSIVFLRNFPLAFRSLRPFLLSASLSVIHSSAFTLSPWLFPRFVS